MKTDSYMPCAFRYSLTCWLDIFVPFDSTERNLSLEPFFLSLTAANPLLVCRLQRTALLMIVGFRYMEMCTISRD